MTSSNDSLDLVTLFKGINIPAVDLTRTAALLRNKLISDWSADFDALIVPGGSSIAELYFRGQLERGALGGWRTPLSPLQLRSYSARLLPQFRYDLTGLLRSVGGIDLVMYEERPGVVRLCSSNGGIARIYERSSAPRRSWCYQLLYCEPISPQCDPLNFLPDEIARGLICHDLHLTPDNYQEPRFDRHFHQMETWLRATFKLEYPGAPTLIPKAFADKATRSDVILTSAPGFNFMRWSKGDHGDLRRESVLSALLLAGPRINSNCKLEQVRLIDLFPTLCHLFDLPRHHYQGPDIDGRLIPGLIKE